MMKSARPSDAIQTAVAAVELFSSSTWVDTSLRPRDNPASMGSLSWRTMLVGILYS